MDAVQLHARAENGWLTFDLPAGNEALSNEHFLVILVPETKAETVTEAAAPRFPPTDWDALQKACDAFEGHDPYPTITDPVAWQREIRAEWTREWERDAIPPQG